MEVEDGEPRAPALIGGGGTSAGGGGVGEGGSFIGGGRSGSGGGSGGLPGGGGGSWSRRSTTMCSADRCSEPDGHW